MNIMSADSSPTTVFVPNELSVIIDAPHLEEWALVGCGVNDRELEAIAQNILSRYQSTTSLLRIDLSYNQLRYITAEATKHFPPSLQILILDGNPILCEANQSRRVVDAAATKALTNSYSDKCRSDTYTDQEDHINFRSSTIRNLLVTFPYLGFLGDDFEAQYIRRSFCTPGQAIELQQMMRDNRNRSRMLEFHARVMDGKHSFAPGLWPRMLEQSLHAFQVSSTWDKHSNDDDDGGDKGRRNSMNKFSVFQNPQELDQRDAIFLMLRERGALEIFRCVQDDGTRISAA
jgi:hypothetical protein